jgi:hypothetical protein
VLGEYSVPVVVAYSSAHIVLVAVVVVYLHAIIRESVSEARVPCK